MNTDTFKNKALTSVTLFDPVFLDGLKKNPNYLKYVANRLGLVIPATFPQVESDDVGTILALIAKVSVSSVDGESSSLPEIQYVIRGIIASLMANYCIPTDDLTHLSESDQQVIRKYANRASLNQEETIVFALACMYCRASGRHDSGCFNGKTLDEIMSPIWNIMGVSIKHRSDIKIIVNYFNDIKWFDMHAIVNINKFIYEIRDGFAGITQDHIDQLTSLETQLGVTFAKIDGRLNLPIDISIYLRHVAYRNGVNVSGVNIWQLICDLMATSYVHYYRFGNKKYPRTTFLELEHIVEPIYNDYDNTSLITIEKAPINIAVLYRVLGLKWDIFRTMIMTTYKLIWIYFMSCRENGIYTAPISILSSKKTIDNTFHERVCQYANGSPLYSKNPFRVRQVDLL